MLLNAELMLKTQAKTFKLVLAQLEYAINRQALELE